MNKRESIRLARRYFKFVLRAHQEIEGSTLPMQPYLFFLCYWIMRLWSGKARKVLINIAPKHSKTFLGTVCLIAWELAHNRGADVIVVTGSETLADEIGRRLVDLLQSRWYVVEHGRCLRRKNVDPTSFRTMHGGTVHVLAIGSNLTGLRSDLTILDDPHDLGRVQSLVKIQLVKDVYRRVIRTRFKNMKRGRTLVMHHRVHDEDLTTELSNDPEFKKIALPFVAPRTRTYRFGGEEWVRRKGDLLRPDAYSASFVKAARTQPEWPLVYQQGVDSRADARLKRSDFDIRDSNELVPAASVISIDPGQGGDIGNGYSCFQVWIPLGSNRHQLVDQIRQRASFEGQCDILRDLHHRYRPSAILIENTALGPALIEFAHKRFRCQIAPVNPHGRSKFERLQEVEPMFRRRRVIVFRDNPCTEAFLCEIEQFPDGAFDDAVDAMTQYLRWMRTRGNLPLVPAPKPGLCAAAGSSGPISAGGVQIESIPGIAAAAYGSRWLRRW